MKTNESSEEFFAKSWRDPYQLRIRQEPSFLDIDYPALSDLLLFMKQQATNDPIRILDFGAGASPYRHLFPNADYRRADIMAGPDLHYQIPENSRIDEVDDTFDLILSTQVLEHVENVAQYLVECHRLLKPGGRMVLTTHGIWEEHGVPFDFQRWTEGGLIRDLTGAGLRDCEIWKLTAGLRAALFFLFRELNAARLPDNGIVRFFFKSARALARRTFHLVYMCLDRHWPALRLTKATGVIDGTSFFVVIAAIARK